MNSLEKSRATDSQHDKKKKKIVCHRNRHSYKANDSCAIDSLHEYYKGNSYAKDSLYEN